YFRSPPPCGEGFTGGGRRCSGTLSANYAPPPQPSPFWGARARRPPARSQPQHLLGDDLVLDLGRAAEDGLRPAVEMGRQQREFVVGQHGRIVEVVQRAPRL